jgi:peroxiredoxin
MIRVSEIIPNVKTMHKNGVTTEWLETHDLFKNKKILLIGIPGPFLVEYASSQMRSYNFLYDSIISLGIDEIWFTSVDDCYVQKAWMKHEGITNIKNLPDPASQWTSAVGLEEDMTKEGLGKTRSHRYAMIIDNLICKTVRYEDFSHNPMTCFQVSDADSMIKYLEGIQNTYEKWNDKARDTVDATGKFK